MRRAFNVLMRIVTSLIGLLMIGMGSIWIMQGIGIGPAAIMQGFMVNDFHWAIYGFVCALLGAGEIVWANTRQVSS
jgi:hypothetical protein